MSWQINEVILQLRSPMHIGYSKIGNLQRTRPYVTGRVLWGALTMRLTRDMIGSDGPADRSETYQKVGEQVHRELAFTYFYPALFDDPIYRLAWPWGEKNDDSNAFRYRFLSGFEGTALKYPVRSAEMGMLREVEYLSPYTLDDGQPVFLMGYVFEKEGCNLRWKGAMDRLQFGGERGYGWGNVNPKSINSFDRDRKLFDDGMEFIGGDEYPVVRLEGNKKLLAHTKADDLEATGEIEPLVGREWRSNQERNQYAGQHIAFNEISFTPGCIVKEVTDFIIGDFGIWKRMN